MRHTSIINEDVNRVCLIKTSTNTYQIIYTKINVATEFNLTLGYRFKTI